MTYSSPRRTNLSIRREFSPFIIKLIQSGYVNSEQIQQALIESRKSGTNLLEILESITGRQLPPELVREYKKNQLFELKIVYGVESFDLDINSVNSHTIKELINTLIPIDVCRRYQLIPLNKKNGQFPVIIVGMVDPHNLEARDDLNRILKPQGLNLQRMVITVEDYHIMVSRYLDEIALEQKQKKQERLTDITQDIESLAEFSIESDEDIDDFETNTSANVNNFIDNMVQSEDAPIITLVNKILAKALQEKATEIYIEPQQECLNVRYRQDGIIYLGFDSLPRMITSAIISRLKVMANLDITKKNIPQKAKIKRKFDGNDVYFYAKFFPTSFGEKVIIKIFHNDHSLFNLDSLITHDHVLETVKSMAKQRGILLVTGTDDSGKTTTLYSLLSSQNTGNLNITTIEDPVECFFKGVMQIPVNFDKQSDYNSLIKSLSNDKIDVLLVDEIPDEQVAQNLVAQTIQGSLILSSFNSQNTINSIFRLQQMGVSYESIAESLIGVINQRLVRRICPVCHLDYTPTPEEKQQLGLTRDQVTIYQANVLNSEKIERVRREGKLCLHCQGKGYKGRIGVYEVLHLNQSLKSLISQGSSSETLTKAAVKQGMIPQFNYALDLVLQGETTLEEIKRVFPDSRPLDVSNLNTSEEEGKELDLLNKRVEDLEKLSQQMLAIMKNEFSELKQQLRLIQERLN